MRIKDKRYGYSIGTLDQWFRAFLFCHGKHEDLSLGEGHPFRRHDALFRFGWCNSDNCSKCIKCGVESHD